MGFFIFAELWNLQCAKWYLSQELELVNPLSFIPTALVQIHIFGSIRVFQKKVLTECCWSHNAQAQSLEAGTPCVWKFFFGRFLPRLSRIKHSYIISMVKFGPTLLNFLKSLILWFWLSNMQYSRAWDVTVANFEYKFAPMDEIFGAFFRFAKPWVEIFAPVLLGHISSKPWCLRILISVRYVFFHEHFALSFCPTLVKCIYGLN